jgi:hypothetical protein
MASFWRERSTSDPLSAAELNSLTAYLEQHTRTPEEYIVGLFTTRDVVLLGEDHAVRHNLELAQRLIPLLYAAGVHNLGMEFGASEDQAALDALVTGSVYSHDTARQLMFNYNVGWAFMEYMDIYRAAWAFNQTLETGAPKFRVLNLSYRFDWTDAPNIRTPHNARRIYHQGPVDAYRANIVEREVLEHGQKIVILTGTTHAFTRHRIAQYDFNAPDFVRLETRQLGQLLHGRAPDRVACVLLHQPFPHRWLGGARRVRPARGAIDQVIAALPGRRFGIHLQGTPFGRLPDESLHAGANDAVRLEDLADGYIIERPFSAYEPCTLDDQFLTSRNWTAAREQIPDPDWHERPRSLEAYWAQIKSYADIQTRYRDVIAPNA